MQNKPWLSWLDLAWGRDPLSLDLNDKSMEGNDVDDQPTPIVKLAQAHHHALILSNFAVEHIQNFNCRCDEI